MTEPRRALVRCGRAGALAAVILVASTTALAQSKPEDAAAAQALFDQAKALMEKNQFAEACPKLAESQRLDPGGGTLLFLASCYEGAGKTASAWSEFNDALSAAKRDNRPDRAKVARERIDGLSPKLMKLAVNAAAAAAATPGLEVKRDAQIVDAALFATPLPVDPGKHTISASAPGYEVWTATLDLTREGATVSVEVPPLVKKVASAASSPPPLLSPPLESNTPPPSAPPPAAGASGFGTLRAVGVVVGSVGLVGVVVGAVFGIKSKSTYDDSAPSCRSDGHCNSVGIQQRQDGIDDGNVSTIAFIAGGALVAGGVALVLAGSRAKGDGKKTAGTTIVVRPLAGRGVSLSGSF